MDGRAEIAWNFESIEVTQRLFCSEIDYILQESAEGHDHCSDDVMTFSEKIAVGVSGGSDSLSLLYLLKHWVDSRGISLVCITVDHKLRVESREEALFVARICEKIGVEHVILDWRKDFQPAHGKLENLARKARYALISDFCKKESINIVTIGHTWSDQLETFEMREKLQSGALGLAGMSRVRSISGGLKLIRPLMIFSREHLRDLLRAERVPWKDDPMNEDERFIRVACRKRLNSLNQDQLQSKSQVITFLGKRRNSIERFCVDFLQRSLNARQVNYGYATLDSAEFAELPEDVRREVLKRIVWNIGGKEYAPNIDDDILVQLNKESNEHWAGNVGRCLLKSSKGQIQIIREDRNLGQGIFVEKSGEFLFDNRFLISLKGYEDVAQRKAESSSSAKYIILSQSEFWRRRGFESFKQFPKFHELYEYSLPCVCCGEDLMFIHGVFRDTHCGLDIRCEFINKVNLFDIFL